MHEELTSTVYTCQKPQHTRCGFFLWMDDAKVREESAVLNNSRSEPTAEPQTPRKPRAAVVPPTPESRPRAQPAPTLSGRKEKVGLEHEDSFGWDPTDDEELATADLTFETPRKAARTQTFTSPGKRNCVEMADDEPAASSTMLLNSWPLSDDVFNTPSTAGRSKSTGLLSPDRTPAQFLTQQTQADPTDPSDLAEDALKILQPANLSKQIEIELVELLNRYDLRMQGIARGRDITRLAVGAKETKIAELQARITGLEAEKETSRTVIAHLKQDIATSPKKGGGRGRGFARRRMSEV